MRLGRVQTKHNALYPRLYRVRREYKQAVLGEIENPFTIDDVRLLSCLVGSGGPRDQALGANALGAAECVTGRWRWTFKDITTQVFGDLHETEAAAAADLTRTQSMLFPSDPHQQIGSIQRGAQFICNAFRRAQRKPWRIVALRLVGRGRSSHRPWLTPTTAARCRTTSLAFAT